MNAILILHKLIKILTFARKNRKCLIWMRVLNGALMLMICMFHDNCGSAAHSAALLCTHLFKMFVNPFCESLLLNGIAFVCEMRKVFILKLIEI